MKQQLIDFYNRHAAAAWYKSSALIGGWLVSAIVLLPDALQIIVDHWDEFSSIVLPTVPLLWKAIILFVYVNFIAPPLRAWAQDSIRVATLKQAVTNGLVVPAGVVGAPVQIMPAADVPAGPDIERLRADPGPL